MDHVVASVFLILTRTVLGVRMNQFTFAPAFGTMAVASARRSVIAWWPTALQKD